MSGHIYVLTDGTNTKIGITTDFDKRMSSYRTHNPNFQCVKSYPCDISQAKRVESAIKHSFKDKLSGPSKEWFSVSADVIVQFVSALLEKPVSSSIRPSMHGVKLTDRAHDVQQKILKLVNEGKKSLASKEEFAELFATAFDLGIPAHKLPDNVLKREAMGVDMAHSAHPAKSRRVTQNIAGTQVTMPNDDHVWPFYHLLKLATGHYIAICTARASMPYLERIDTPDKQLEMVDRASEVGWYCTIHNDWSWHSPDKTGLVLYEPKTPVVAKLRQFDGSFRLWVIERQELLKFSAFPDQETLAKALEDIAHDNTFPLGVQSYQEFCESYLEPVWTITGDEFFAKDAYEFLFAKWKQETQAHK
jgi:hypothetical protein